MKITVVGAGAMGSLFGALLAEAGEDVTLLDIWPEHVAAINSKGLSIEAEAAMRSVALRAVTDSAQAGPADLVIIFVKSGYTPQAAATAKSILKENGLVLTLQNGMGNADAIARVVAPSRVIAGTTSHGATLLGPARIRHAGRGPTIIGPWAAPDAAGAETVARCLNHAGIETTLDKNVRSVVWNKLLINVGINAVAALTGIRNGQIQDLAATRWIARSAVQEAMAVAGAMGVKVRQDAVAHMFHIAAATGANRCSMGQDVDHKRRTEIGAINGYVVQEADRLGLPSPVNRTLAGLVETLQEHF